MGDTLHILVSCSLEETRATILKDVVESLEADPTFPYEDTIVFDNNSTSFVWGVFNKFKHVVRARENYGYWSAVNWVLRNAPELLGKSYKYVYVIESDMHHTAYGRISVAEQFLNDNPDIGSVRLQEFYVAQSHLYDKNHPVQESRRYAWTRLSNHFTGKKAYFKPDEKYQTVYRTNLAPQVPALNRMSFMWDAFEELEKKPKLAEVDFQEVYFRKYSETALLDGGIYNCEASFASDVLSGSYTDIQKLAGVGYRMTRFDSIVPAAKVAILA